MDVWQIQRMEEAALERLIGPEARALKRRAQGHGGTTLRRRPAAPLGEPRDHALARPARPGHARGDARRCSPPGWRASSGTRDLVARTVTPQAAARRFPHRHPAAHVRDGHRSRRRAVSAPPASSSARRSPTCGAGIAASVSSASRPPTWASPPRPTCSSRRRAAGSGDLSAAVDQLRDKYGFAAVTPGSALSARRRLATTDALRSAPPAGPCPRSAAPPSRPRAVTCGPRSRNVAPRPSPVRAPARCCSGRAGSSR